MLVAATAAVFALAARDAHARVTAGERPGMFDSLSVFRTSGRAWALLTGVHHLSKSDGGARAAGGR